MFEATFHGIECWHRHVFEKLGWMVLAANRPVIDGEISKLNMYSQEISHLHTAITEKIAEVEKLNNPSNVRDLQILKSNIEKLQKFVASNLKQTAGGAKRKSKRSKRKTAKKN